MTTPDPLPDIPLSLLNHEEIKRYIEKAGIVKPKPEKFDETNLKNASLQMHVGETFMYWDKNGKFVEKDLEIGEKVEIPKNSIVFVSTEEEFNLPNYIAARFNLNITLVHKGFLLGTGPLVDPGFKGKLLVPLHNLTTNDYWIERKKPFIWVEFTKISHSDGDGSDKNESVKIPEKPKRLSHYLDKARRDDKEGPVVHNSVRSSLPSLEKKVESGLEKIDSRLRETKTWVVRWTWGGIVGFLGLIVSLVVLFYQAMSLIRDADEFTSTVRVEIQGQVNDLERKIPLLESQIDEKSQQLTELKKQVDVMKSEIEKVKKRGAIEGDIEKDKNEKEDTG